MSRRVALSNNRVTLGLIVLAAACGPSSTRNGNGSGSGGPDGGGGPVYDAPACATSNVKADQVPLDLYIMLDQSGSMSDSVSGGGTKWSAVTSALDTFVTQPGLSGVAVGLQYFGVPPGGGGTCSVLTCNVDADCGAAACGPCIANLCTGFLSGGTDSCTASDYAMPSVEISPLPGVASQIQSSISMHSPTTGTPTSAALQGAVDHAKSWATSHAGDAVAVIFATDGDPSECDTDLSHINAIASAAFTGTPKVPTFVIGVGPSLSALNGIAAAGGTTQAFLVDTGGNVNQQFLAAMNAIRHAALGCVYQIPVPSGGGTPDYNTVNVVFTPSGGPSRTFPYVMSQANCPASGDGWYYDNPQHPTQIILCSATCTAVEADMMGEVDITLGCGTVIL
jgi:hypothetical protein